MAKGHVWLCFLAKIACQSAAGSHSVLRWRILVQVLRFAGQYQLPLATRALWCFNLAPLEDDVLIPATYHGNLFGFYVAELAVISDLFHAVAFLLVWVPFRYAIFVQNGFLDLVKRCIDWSFRIDAEKASVWYAGHYTEVICLLPLRPWLYWLEYLLRELVWIEACLRVCLSPFFVDFENVGFESFFLGLQRKFVLLNLCFKQFCVLITLLWHTALITWLCVNRTRICFFGCFYASVGFKIFIVEHEDSLHLDQSRFQELLLVHELWDQLVLTMQFFFEHSDDIILAFQHIGQIPSQWCKTIVRLPLCLALLYGHPTLQTIVAARAIVLFVLDDIHSVDCLATIDALDGYIWTNCFMLFNLTLYAFCAASFESLTFHCVELAYAIVLGDLIIIQNNIASHDVISTFELHFGKFLLNFLFDAYELRFEALHRAHSGLSMKLFKTFMMISCATWLAFDRIYKYCLAESTKILRFQLIFCQQIWWIEREWLLVGATLHICLRLYFLFGSGIGHFHFRIVYFLMKNTGNVRFLYRKIILYSLNNS